MKTKLFVLLAAVFSIMLLNPSVYLHAQNITGSRNVQSETREVPFFDAVKVGGSMDLYITQGDEFLVEVVADDNILQYIETRVNNGVLEIGMKPRTSLRRYSEMKVYVTAPRFTSIQTSGSADAFATNTIRQESLQIRTSGSSDVKMDLVVNYLEIVCSGSSDAILSGQADNLKAKFSGSSDLKAPNLSCSYAELDFSGSSDATLRIEKEVVGSLRGSSDLKIYGKPSIQVSTSGSSSVKAGL